MGKAPVIRVENQWEELASAVRERPGVRVVYVIGAANRGKTTFCRYLARSLSTESPVAYIDCDPGQSSIGPPATIGLQEMSPSGAPAGRPLLYFIGSTSPKGHLLPCLSGLKKLNENACARGLKTIILDSSGFVLDKVAREFQFHVIDLLQPDFLAAFQQEGELEALLGNFAGHPRVAIYRVPVSPAVEVRTISQRQSHRRRLFRTYFREAVFQDLGIQGRGLHGRVPDLTGKDSLEGLLAAVCERENFAIALGIIVSYDAERERLSLLAPPFEAEAVASVHFGSLSLNPDEYR